MDLISSLAHLSAIHMLMAMVPGPNTVLVSYCSAGMSRRAGLLAAAGVAAASLLWVTTSLVGMGAVLTHAVPLYNVTRTLGALYLVHVGIKLLRARPAGPASEGKPVYRSPMMAGFLTTLSNPKSAIFWTSVFAVVLPRDAPPWFYAAVLALITVQAIVWYGTVALALSSEFSRRHYQRLSTVLTKVAGFCMLGFGIKIAAEFMGEHMGRS